MTAAKDSHCQMENEEEQEHKAFWEGVEEEYSEEEEEENESPYAKNLDVEAGQHISREDSQPQLAHLPQAPEKPTTGMRSETLIIVDRNIIASRIIHLQQLGIIL